MAQSLISKAVHVITTNRPGKWKSINLSNLAKELTLSQLREVVALATPVLIASAQSAVDKFTELKAPPIILDHMIKTLTKAQNDKHPCLSTIRTRIKKLT